MIAIRTERLRRDRIARLICVVTAIPFAGALIVGVVTDRSTLVVVVTLGFLAMVAGVTISLFVDFSAPGRQVWAYGLASGAIFVLWQALAMG